MSLGLHLAATVGPTVDRDRIGRWALRRLPDAEIRATEEDGAPGIALRIHPAAEEVRLGLPAPDRLVIEASTSGVGPGYHAHLVELLDELAALLGLTWAPAAPGEAGDDTGYFRHRDRRRLEEEMRRWLRAVAAQVRAPSPGGWDVGLGLDHRYELPAHARTALGPRDAAFWEAVADGTDGGEAFFPWWEPRQGAGHHLGVALTLLWTEVRFRPPCTDGETGVLRRVADALAAAHALEPGRAYPWREWDEVLALLGESGPLAAEVAARARAAPDGPRAGYRRHPVRALLGGGWSIRIPGAFAESWEGSTFSAWGGGRTLWFTAYRRTGDAPDAAELRARVGDGAVSVHVRTEGPLTAAAGLRRAEEDGEPFWQLETQTAVGERLAVCTICFEEEAQLGWALETWQSIAGEAG